MNRLLVITELFLPTRGGTAVWAAEVYRRMGGKEIHVVTADVPGASAIDAVHPNTIHRVDLRRVPWLRPESLAMYGRLFLKSLWLSLTHRFDAIHAFRALPEGLVAWSVGRLTLKPTVTYAHGEELTSWGHGGKYKAMRFALRHADRVIANSEHTRATLLAMGVDPDRIEMIHPGVDVGTFRPGLDTTGLRERLGIAPGEKLLFSVGRLSRRKGFDRVIEAVAQLRRDGMPVHFALAGIGEDEAYLRDHILAQGLLEHVDLLGALSDDELPRWMNACDVFAMPNREIDGDNEGFGMVFIEAAACGKPVVAGTAGGTGSAVQDGVTGFRVNGDDVTAVVSALNRLLADPDLARRMGDAGLARVRAEFAWERVADKTRQLQRQLQGTSALGRHVL